MASKNVAQILALLPTGWFGGHHFYLGNRIRGVLYFLFSWTLIPGFLAIIYAIRLQRRSDEEFLKKYGSEDELNELYIERLQDSGVIGEQFGDVDIQNGDKNQNRKSKDKSLNDEETIEDDDFIEESSDLNYDSYYGQYDNK